LKVGWLALCVVENGGCGRLYHAEIGARGCFWLKQLVTLARGVLCVSCCCRLQL
jgi:hypothetical protein